MLRHFTLEYWLDDGWYVGRIKEVPGIFSQGETIKELEENISDAYKMVMKDQKRPRYANLKTKELLLKV